MPGVPGAGGPVPKRSTERRRRNADSATQVVAPPLAAVEAPPLPEDTAPLAREWYESLQTSGQAQFYEPSDWLSAKILAAQLTAHISSGYRSAVMFSAIWSAMGELLTTEGARRRVRLEIDRPVADAVKPANVTDYRARLTKGGRR
jgi:hypothetical protein